MATTSGLLVWITSTVEFNPFGFRSRSPCFRSTCMVLTLTLLVAVPWCNGQYSCNPPRRDLIVEWRPEVMNVTVEWRLDQVCSSTTQCYGPNGADTPLDAQLCPISMQRGDTLYLLPPPVGSPYTTTVVNVTEEEFYACPSRAYPETQILRNPDPDGRLRVPERFVGSSGVFYLVQHPDGAFSNCRYGLRLRILVRDMQCLPTVTPAPAAPTLPNANLPCSGRGVCGALPLDEGFRCQCNENYRGDFCDEFDACASNPCHNGAPCLDGKEGLLGSSFVCICTEGFTGPLCTEIIGQCFPGICGNGTCVPVSAEAFVCNCLPGYTGTFCERAADACSPNPCQNGAACVRTAASQGSGGFECQCRPGYTGSRCETDIDECASSPCAEGATCVDYVNGFFCNCPPGFNSDLCRDPVDFCASNPCVNEGTCIALLNGFYCNCTVAYRGERCEERIGRCSQVPDLCKNGGHCLSSPEGPIQCQCSPGWTGPTCEQLDNFCRFNPCPEGLVCTDTSSVLQPGAFLCSCPPGYTGARCETEIQECASTPCLNRGVCVDRLAGYDCICAQGYTGKNCETNIDACEGRGALLCRNNATCVDGDIGFNYRCICAPGYTSADCSVNIDECISSPCLFNGTCTDHVNGFTCSCQEGFFGTRCERFFDYCSLGACRNGATCIGFVGNYRCDCRPGWSGRNCTEDVDECASSPCLNGATCRNLENQFRCDCAGDFIGQRCESSFDHCNPSPCVNGATCVDLIGDFRCDCAQGYAGRRCEREIFECLSTPCQNGGICQERVNGYSCFCDPTLWEGVHCEIALNNCSRSPCLNGATCRAQSASDFTCACAPRYTGRLCETPVPLCRSAPCLNGATCEEDVEALTYRCRCSAAYIGDRCENKRDFCVDHKCQNGATCVDGERGHTCVCPAGFTGRYCQTDVDACASQPCLNGGRCQDTVGGYECFCANGFSGTNCSMEVNECSSDPFTNGGFCVDGLGGYTCYCPQGFAGDQCEENIDDCLGNLCKNGAVCVDGINQYTCRCLEGFVGSDCSFEIDECLSSPCDAVGTFLCTDAVASYTCVCHQGFTGVRCESSLNECDSNPCQNAATCIDGRGQYECVCRPGYTGTNCEIRIDNCASAACGAGTCIERVGGYVCECPNDGINYDASCQPILPCSSNPCLNDGTCVDEFQGGNPISFTCRCRVGYEGDTCQTTNFCRRDNVTCQNGGLCVNVQNNFTCVCTAGYTGRFCGVNIDECAAGHFCQNGATCVDGLAGYQCRCSAGYVGRFCENVATSCTENPCRNDATCLNIPNPLTGTRFTCVCPEGFEGGFCHIPIDACSSQPCLHGGTCSQTAIGAFSCTCLPGFTGATCQTNIDECVGHGCQNNGVCVDLVNGYTCLCPRGFTGSLCQSEVDDCDSSPCQNGGQCLDVTNGYRCFCRNGYTGLQCQVDYDECLSNPCQHSSTCVNQVASFSCLCPAGITGVLCETNINECNSSPCRNGATCVDLVNGFNCTCPAGFTGRLCETDLDECLSNPCLNGGTCRDRQGHYICDCPQPYRGANCQLLPCDLSPCESGGTCFNDPTRLPDGFRCQCIEGLTGTRCQSNIDDCVRPDGQVPCQGRGLCLDDLNKYVCLCQPGWKGQDCEVPIDECTDNQCQNGASCVNLWSGYRCDCTAGFEGQFCERETDECEPNPCKNGANCIDLHNDFRCQCREGWTGKDCSTEIDECVLTGRNPCLNGATCVDAFAGFTCQCAPFFTGTTCDVRFDPCDVTYNQCQNEARCLTRPNGGYFCQCLEGYTGTNCEIDIDECTSNPCVNGGRCEDRVAGYRCYCPLGFTGTRCEVNIDDCGACRNGASCQDFVNGYICTCTEGFRGVNCTEDINECLLGTPCQNQATCTNNYGNYTCTCQNGFTGTNCEIDIDECASSPCQNGALCRQGAGQFACFCLLGYTGTLCEVNIDDCSPHPCGNGLCTDLVNGYSCTCNPGWTGATCSVNIDECLSTPCSNGATCVDGINSYTCQCPEGYTGLHCKVDTEVCRKDNVSQCLNGGTCNEGPGSSFDCICVPGYTGSFCETEIDECFSEPCQNGATCQDRPSGYTCSCSTGWAGLVCNLDIDECESSPCQNGGLCQQRQPGNGFECLCLAGLGGTLCEINYNDCEPAPRCLNGGTCVDGLNTFTCMCPPETSGQLCETLLVTSTEMVMPSTSLQPSPTGGVLVTSLEGATPFASLVPGLTGSPLVVDSSVALVIVVSSLSEVVTSLSSDLPQLHSSVSTETDAIVSMVTTDAPYTATSSLDVERTDTGQGTDSITSFSMEFASVDRTIGYGTITSSFQSLYGATAAITNSAFDLDPSAPNSDLLQNFFGTSLLSESTIFVDTEIVMSKDIKSSEYLTLESVKSELSASVYISSDIMNSEVMASEIISLELMTSEMPFETYSALTTTDVLLPTETLGTESPVLSLLPSEKSLYLTQVLDQTTLTRESGYSSLSTTSDSFLMDSTLKSLHSTSVESIDSSKIFDVTFSSEAADISILPSLDSLLISSPSITNTDFEDLETDSSESTDVQNSESDDYLASLLITSSVMPTKVLASSRVTDDFTSMLTDEIMISEVTTTPGNIVSTEILASSPVTDDFTSMLTDEIMISVMTETPGTVMSTEILAPSFVTGDFTSVLTDGIITSEVTETPSDGTPTEISSPSLVTDDMTSVFTNELVISGIETPGTVVSTEILVPSLEYMTVVQTQPGMTGVSDTVEVSLVNSEISKGQETSYYLSSSSSSSYLHSDLVDPSLGESYLITGTISYSPASLVSLQPSSSVPVDESSYVSSDILHGEPSDNLPVSSPSSTTQYTTSLEATIDVLRSMSIENPSLLHAPTTLLATPLHSLHVSNTFLDDSQSTRPPSIVDTSQLMWSTETASTELSSLFKEQSASFSDTNADDGLLTTVAQSNVDIGATHNDFFSSVTATPAETNFIDSPALTLTDLPGDLSSSSMSADFTSDSIMFSATPTTAKAITTLIDKGSDFSTVEDLSPDLSYRTDAMEPSTDFVTATFVAETSFISSVSEPVGSTADVSSTATEGIETDTSDLLDTELPTHSTQTPAGPLSTVMSSTFAYTEITSVISSTEIQPTSTQAVLSATLSKTDKDINQSTVEIDATQTEGLMETQPIIETDSAEMSSEDVVTVLTPSVSDHEDTSQQQTSLLFSEVSQRSIDFTSKPSYIFETVSPIEATPSTEDFEGAATVTEMSRSETTDVMDTELFSTLQDELVTPSSSDFGFTLLPTDQVDSDFSSLVSMTDVLPTSSVFDTIITVYESVTRTMLESDIDATTTFLSSYYDATASPVTLSEVTGGVTPETDSITDDTTPGTDSMTESPKTERMTVQATQGTESFTASTEINRSTLLPETESVTVSSETEGVTVIETLDTDTMTISPQTENITGEATPETVSVAVSSEIDDVTLSPEAEGVTATVTLDTVTMMLSSETGSITDIETGTVTVSPKPGSLTDVATQQTDTFTLSLETQSVTDIASQETDTMTLLLETEHVTDEVTTVTESMTILPKTDSVTDLATQETDTGTVSPETESMTAVATQESTTISLSPETESNTVSPVNDSTVTVATPGTNTILLSSGTESSAVSSETDSVTIVVTTETGTMTSPEAHTVTDIAMQETDTIMLTPETETGAKMTTPEMDTMTMSLKSDAATSEMDTVTLSSETDSIKDEVTLGMTSVTLSPATSGMTTIITAEPGPVIESITSIVTPEVETKISSPETDSVTNSVTTEVESVTSPPETSSLTDNVTPKIDIVTEVSPEVDTVSKSPETDSLTDAVTEDLLTVSASGMSLDTDSFQPTSVNFADYTFSESVTESVETTSSLLSDLRPDMMTVSDTSLIEDSMVAEETSLLMSDTFPVSTITVVPTATMPTATMATTMDSSPGPTATFSMTTTSDAIQPTSLMTSSPTVDVTATPEVTTSMTTPEMTTEEPEPATCADSPCLNGGTCFDVTSSDGIRSFFCLCVERYGGHRCQTPVIIDPMEFTGRSLLTFDPIPLLSENVIKLSMRTVASDGVIFYSARDYTVTDSTHYIRLLVKGGILHYEFSCIAQSFNIESNVKVDTGDLFNISIMQSAECKATLEVTWSQGSSSLVVGMPFVFPSLRLVELSTFYIGGLPGNLSYVPGSAPNFAGCVSVVDINGQDYGYLQAKTWVNIAECSDILPTGAPVVTSTPSPLPTCDDAICQNGGTCRDVPPSGGLAYACDCPLHYVGRHCEQEIGISFPAFSGRSYLKHRDLDLGERGSGDLYVTFKTTEADGTLLYAASAASGEFVHLFVEDGRLKYQASCGHINVIFVDTRAKVNHNNLTSAQVRQIERESGACEVTVTVDSDLETTVTLSASAPNQGRTFDLGPLYLGGLPPGVTPVPRATPFVNFVGCMRHLQINGEERLIFQDAVEGANIAECDVPPCTFHPCYNNATCIPSVEGYTCECLPSYRGALCERTACEPSPCRHGGTCVHRPMEGSYTCLCPYGRHGINCEEALPISRPEFFGTQLEYISFLAYSPVPGLDLIFDFRFSFTLEHATSHQDGLMIFAGQESTHARYGADFFAVGIQDGHLHFQYNLGSGLAHITSLSPIDLNRTVHHVVLGRNRRQGYLRVNDQRNATGSSGGTLVGLNVFSRLFVGGYDNFNVELPAEVAFKDGFKGCLFNLEVRTGTSTPWRLPGSPQGHVDTGRNVGQCGRPECDVTSCDNGATCVDLGATHRCECSPGWTGPRCSARQTPCDAGHDCAEGATCYPLVSGGYTCHCPLGRAGEKCDEEITITDARFVGESSYMNFRHKGAVRFAVDIRLQFRPEVITGLLLYMAEHLSVRSGDFLSVSLRDGIVELRFRVGTAPTVVISAEGNVTTNAWNTVDVGRNTTHGYVTFNGRTTSVKVVSEMVGLDVTTPVYIGGVPNLDDLAPSAVADEPSAFEGCVREVTVNKHRFELSEKGAYSGVNVEDCDGTSCGHDVCRNGGTCFPIRTDGFVCVCPGDYYGTRCEISSLCRNHACAEGATCVPEVASANYTCTCPLGRRGRHCEEEIQFSAAQFSGNSYILHHDPNYNTTDVTKTYLSFNFSTSATNGLMLWNGQAYSDQDDYLGVGIHQSRVRVVISLGWWTREDVLSDQTVSDQLWHSIIITRSARRLSVYVDGNPTHVTLAGDFDGLNTSGSYYLGGFEIDTSVRDETCGRFDTPFIGCLRDLHLSPDSPAVDLEKAASGANIQSCDAR